MPSIFSQEALRKRRIPGDLAGPITLMTAPLRAALGTGLVLVAAGVGWSFMARIPITVNAVGALLPVSTINIGQMNVTRIAIAHRLSTILQAYQIIVLLKGKSPEIGTWEDRLKAGGYLSKINDLN